MPTKEVRRSGYADIHGSESALRRGMYSESAPARTVEPLEALGIDPVVGPHGGFALRPRPKTQGCAIELEGGGGARRGAISVH